MHLKSASFLLGLLLFTLHLTAQTGNPKNKVYVRSINAVGLLNGGGGTSAILQTINGASVNRWFAGIGVGLDYYRYRSVPLFVDLRREFGQSNNRLFVYGDAGYHFDWLTDGNRQHINSFSAVNDFRGGSYYDLGAGVAINVKQRQAVLLSAGYSYKHLENKTKSNFCPVIGPCYGDNDSYQYALSRLVIKAAYAF